MSILVNKDTKVIVQGITGREGEFHTQQMIAYGTQVVGGVTPGKGGQTVQDVPVFDTVQDAVSGRPGQTPPVSSSRPASLPTASWRPPTRAWTSSSASPRASPLRTRSRPSTWSRISNSRLLGPNCPGILTVNACKIGIIPSNIFTPGPVGIVSRSGTLTYESVDALTRAGLGQTTCVGVGGDPMPGTRFLDVLPLFEADPETKAVVMCGEVGGTDEEVAAEYIKTMTKPVIGFIAGLTAPPGKRMGHAGAIISGTYGGPQAKVDALRAAGVHMAESTADIPGLVKKALGL